MTDTAQPRRLDRGPPTTILNIDSRNGGSVLLGSIIATIHAHNHATTEYWSVIAILQITARSVNEDGGGGPSNVSNSLRSSAKLPSYPSIKENL